MFLCEYWFNMYKLNKKLIDLVVRIAYSIYYFKIYELVPIYRQQENVSENLPFYAHQFKNIPKELMIPLSSKWNKIEKSFINFIFKRRGEKQNLLFQKVFGKDELTLSLGYYDNAEELTFDSEV